MFYSSRFAKGDRAINDLPQHIDKADGAEDDGRFKPGPQTKEKRRGDNAFETAKGHLDDAADTARAGDQEGANYHLNMAHQYAQMGVQNHMMSDFHGKSKALAARKVED